VQYAAQVHTVCQQESQPSNPCSIQTHKLRFESATKRYYLHYTYGEADSDDTQTPTAAPVAGASSAPSGKSNATAKPAAAAAMKGKRGGGPGGVGGSAMFGTQQALMMKGKVMSHYGCGAAHEALYEGFFLDAGAARQYMALFKSESG